MKRCAEAGLGVTVVPNIAVERELAEGLLVELALDAPGLDYRFVLATRRGEDAAADGERAARDPPPAGSRLTPSGTSAYHEPEPTGNAIAAKEIKESLAWNCRRASASS